MKYVTFNTKVCIPLFLKKLRYVHRSKFFKKKACKVYVIIFILINN